MDYTHVGSIYSDKMQRHTGLSKVLDSKWGIRYSLLLQHKHPPLQLPTTSTFFCFTGGAALPISAPLAPPQTQLSHIYILVHKLHIYFLDHSPPNLHPSNSPDTIPSTSMCFSDQGKNCHHFSHAALVFPLLPRKTRTQNTHRTLTFVVIAHFTS